MSYFTLALFPMCYILSLSLLHDFSSLAPTSSLYLFSRCLHFIRLPSFMCISHTRHATTRHENSENYESTQVRAQTE